MYSSTTGAGGAVSGSHSRALSCIPSFMAIHWFSITRTGFLSGSFQPPSPARAAGMRHNIATGALDISDAAEPLSTSRREIGILCPRTGPLLLAHFHQQLRPLLTDGSAPFLRVERLVF